jgi:hypothetical protein
MFKQLVTVGSEFLSVQMFQVIVMMISIANETLSMVLILLTALIKASTNMVLGFQLSPTIFGKGASEEEVPDAFLPLPNT